MTFDIMKKEEFSSVYGIMRESFPKPEIRNYDGELSLLKRKDYRVFVIRKKSAVQAFIAEWTFNRACYIEHFAVKPDVRGNGLGTRALNCYLRRKDIPVIIEVEDLQTATARRRIFFYERLGFALSNIRYMQPPLRSESEDVPLRMMYYPSRLHDGFLNEAKRKIFTVVYNKTTA